ncbi:MAG: hypothetical protein IKN63_04680 [Bacilli bacterium]|nr:hypothetical protein [Bacilli bacterium]
MSDIRIDKVGLSSLIKTLESDNINLVNIVKNMHNSINFLDESKWSSSEKTKLDSQINNDLNKVDKYLLSYLNECTDLLKQANTSYSETNSNLQSEIEIL